MSAPTILMRKYEPRVETAADPVTERIRGIWTAGDFGRIAVSFAPSAEAFVERLHLKRGERVLDVACGTGNLAIPAARAGAITTGIDIAPNLIDQANVNAMTQGLDIRFEVGNAEELPYPDAHFDTVISMFGAMFAARPDRAAKELLRVTKPGGRIVMANWTPTGFIGQMLRTVVGYVPPPPGSISVLEWGKEATVLERFAGAASVTCRPYHATLSFPFDPAATVRTFKMYYGPTVKAFGALDASSQAKLGRDLTTLWRDHNRGLDGATAVDSEYLEVTVIR